VGERETGDGGRGDGEKIEDRGLRMEDRGSVEDRVMAAPRDFRFRGPCSSALSSILYPQSSILSPSPCLVAYTNFLMNAFEKLSTMMRLARRARRQKLSPQSEIVGLMGRAETSLAPDGMVFVRNELWHARSLRKIEADQIVIVNGIEGLVLRVEAQ